jgi:hypothetical protein
VYPLIASSTTAITQTRTTASQEPCASDTVGILTEMTSSGPTLEDPGAAVSYLEEISPEMRGCAILDATGEVFAASGEAPPWTDPARELIAAADAAEGEPVAHAHLATGDAEVFCVRHGDLICVAVAERFVLSSLMVFDLRSALRDLARGS